MGFNLIYWTRISGSYFLKHSILEKCGFFFEKRPFSRADMAGLGKYCMGGYGRIGVYRVNVGFSWQRTTSKTVPLLDTKPLIKDQNKSPGGYDM